MYVDDLDIPSVKITEAALRVIDRAVDEARRRQGNEGFIGINALFGGVRWFAGAVVKVPDRAAQATVATSTARPFLMTCVIEQTPSPGK